MLAYAMQQLSGSLTSFLTNNVTWKQLLKLGDLGSAAHYLPLLLLTITLQWVMEHYLLQLVLL